MNRYPKMSYNSIQSTTVKKMEYIQEANETHLERLGIKQDVNLLPDVSIFQQVFTPSVYDALPNLSRGRSIVQQKF